MMRSIRRRWCCRWWRRSSGLPDDGCAFLCVRLTAFNRKVREGLAKSAKVSARANMAIIGVISDTHGLLRPEAVEALAGSERIIHAGDVGDPAILQRLSQIAPVTG